MVFPEFGKGRILSFRVQTARRREEVNITTGLLNDDDDDDNNNKFFLNFWAMAIFFIGWPNFTKVFSDKMEPPAIGRVYK